MPGDACSRRHPREGRVRGVVGRRLLLSPPGAP